MSEETLYPREKLTVLAHYLPKGYSMEVAVDYQRHLDDLFSDVECCKQLVIMDPNRVNVQIEVIYPLSDSVPEPSSYYKKVLNLIKEAEQFFENQKHVEDLELPSP